MSDDRVFKCTECGVEIRSNQESTPKMFKLHVKRNHKSELQRYDKDGETNYPYREFLTTMDIQKIRDSDVPM